MLSQSDRRNQQVTLVNPNGVTFLDLKQLAAAVLSKNLPDDVQVQFFAPNSTVPIAIGRVVLDYSQPIDAYRDAVIAYVKSQIETQSEPTPEPEPEPEPEPTPEPEPAPTETTTETTA